MLKFKNLDHVQVCIAPGTEAEAREFYSNILRLEEIPKPAELLANGGMWYKIADIQLHIGVEPNAQPSKRHPAFEVEDIQQAREYLAKNNVPIKEDTKIPGVERFSFFDPFGNRFELLQKI